MSGERLAATYATQMRGRDLRILFGRRVKPLRAMPDGSHVMSGGLLVGT